MCSAESWHRDEESGVMVPGALCSEPGSKKMEGGGRKRKRQQTEWRSAWRQCNHFTLPDTAGRLTLIPGPLRTPLSRRLSPTEYVLRCFCSVVHFLLSLVSVDSPLHVLLILSNIERHHVSYGRRASPPPASEGPEAKCWKKVTAVTHKTDSGSVPRRRPHCLASEKMCQLRWLTRYLTNFGFSIGSCLNRTMTPFQKLFYFKKSQAVCSHSSQKSARRLQPVSF